MGGSCLRERRCSSEVITALPKMPIAVPTKSRTTRSARGAQDSGGGLATGGLILALHRREMQANDAH